MRAPFSISDLALAGRLMRKQPVLTTTAILALATGIFLATTGFTFLEAVIWARLPFSGGDRFVLLDVYEEPAARRGSITDERFQMLRGNAPAFQHLGAFASSRQNLLLPSGDVALIPTLAITPDSFAVLPYAPVVGRALTVADRAPTAPLVTVLRESLWRRHFSANPEILGTAVNFAGVQRIVVGIMPDALEFPNSPEAWFPLQKADSARVFGVLTSPEALPLAQTQLTTVSQQFERSRPEAPKLRIQALPFAEALSRGLDLLTGALVFVLVLVLLVISANIANLVLARTLSRSSELAIRSALGASRTRLVAQVFCEVLALGAVAAAIGLAASQVMLNWIEATMTEMPFWVDFSASPLTIAFVVAITLLASAVGGALPALRATRRDPSAALSATSRRVTHGFGLAGSAMVTVQIALSIAALHAALVVARGVAGYMEGAPTPMASQVLTAVVYAAEPLDAREAQSKVVDAVGRMASVQNVALSTSLPRLSPSTLMTTVRSGPGAVESSPSAAPVVSVSPQFFDTLGAGALAGRVFTANDFSTAAVPVAVVNRPFAEKFFGGRNPIGQQLRIVDSEAPDAGQWREIVGVVPDLGLSSGDSELAGGFYLPLADERRFHVSLRSATDPAPLAHALQRAVADADPRIQVNDIQPLNDVGSEDRAVFAGIGGALTGLGGMSLLLSVIGVYAMLSFSVTQRTREIAVRTALGATRPQILRALLARSAVPFVVGTIAGPLLGSALVAARGIFAFRLPADAGPWAGLSLCLLMIGAGVLAALVPGRRALAINTSDALKAE